MDVIVQPARRDEPGALNAIIHPGVLRGSVQVPASKSAAHRAFIAAALSDEETAVRVGALGRDPEATLRCLSALGAMVSREGGVVRVRRGAVPTAAVELDCGESASTLRFLLPLACALGVRGRFAGCGRLPERPHAALIDALRAHGAKIDSDRLPLTAAGPLEPGAYVLPGDVSSQFVTGLLFALPLLDGDSEIILTTKLASAAYVEMTLRTLRQFGVAAEPTGFGWRVSGGQRYRSPGGIDIEGDWSAAAFWLAANRMGSDVRVEGLSEASAHGDRAVTRLLGMPEIDASNVPDLVPALAVAAATLPGPTVFTGAARLRGKESDRLAATADLIGALGGRAEVTPDGLIVRGGQPLRGGRVDGRGDHRIVMAAAIAATAATGPVTVTGAGVVEKSYPDFFRDFAALGGHVYVEPSGQ